MRCLAAGVVLLVAAVSGCSAGEAAPVEVGPLASGSASAGASAAAVPRDPTVSPEPSGSAGAASPDDSKANYAATVEGASAFARDYVRLIGQGFAIANPEEVRLRSAPGCEGCEALMGAMEQAARDGLRRRGGEYTVTSVATPPVEGRDVLLLLTYTRAASEIVDASNNVVDRAAAVAETTVQMRVVFGPAGWRTQGYRVV